MYRNATNTLALTATLVVLLVASLFATPASAADKIATINIQAILQESDAAKSTRDQIDSKRKQYQSELKAIEDKLQKEDQALAEQRSLLSPDALKEKQKEFASKITDAQKELQEKRQRLDAAYGKALNDIQAGVLEIVKEMAEERGYTLIVPTSQLLYAVPSLDITDEVLAQLNKDLPTVKIDFNAKLPN